MGAHFRLPIYRAVPIVRLLAELPETSLVALDASAASTVYDYNWPGRTALVIGSEAHGLSPEVAESAAERVRIPMRSGVESLNAAVAASIALYAALGPEISSQS
jgi:TrmH family RNA methyltransferase